jgi:hypothetical protein
MGQRSGMPLKRKLVIPPFRNEMEEAAWWEKRRAEVEADLRLAMRERNTISLEDVLTQANTKRNLSS